MCQNYLLEDTVNQCVKFIYQKTQSTNVSNLSTNRHSQPMCLKLSTKRHSQPMCQIYLPKDTVNQCVEIIYQKTQSTNVSNLPIKRHSQPMCQSYLLEDTVNQCVKFIYQQTQSTNVSKLSTRRHSQPMCQIYLP